MDTDADDLDGENAVLRYEGILGVDVFDGDTMRFGGGSMEVHSGGG